MPIIKPDAMVRFSKISPMVFLGGSIDNGKATDWQWEAEEYFKYVEARDGFDIVVANPRRAVWNSNLEQTKANEEFQFQVRWELEHIERADAVMIWLASGSYSPVSMLELGLLAGQTSAGCLNKLVIGCEDGFWRRGNVEIVAERFKIPLVSTLEETVKATTELMLRNHARRIGYSYEQMLGE